MTASWRRPISSFLLVSAFVLVAIPGWAGYKRVNKPNPNDPMNVEIYRLDNGLMVYLTENDQEPRFNAEIAVRAGGKHDPHDNTGLAHYFEHLMFKGSRRLGSADFGKERPHLERIAELYEERFNEADPARREAIYAEINTESQKAASHAIPNELQKVYNAMGEWGMNAHTGWEETVFKVGLPSNRLRQWARVEADRFAHPILRLFQTELETVYEEKNGSLDSKGGLIFQAIQRQLYKRHPYGMPILGTVEDLKNPSIHRIVEFYETYYVPNNMGLFISGDIDTDEAIGIVDEAFSSWTPGELPPARLPKEKALDGPERVTVQYPGEEYLMLAFRTVPRGHRRTEALMLVDMVLDNSVAGLINLNITHSQKARSAGCSPMTNNDYGAQLFYGVPKQGQTLAELEALLLAQIELVKRGRFDDWIIPAIVTDFKKSRKASLESNSSRVAMMRGAFIAEQDWDYAVDLIERVEKLDRWDVVSAARKYFRDDYVAGYRIDAPYIPPKIEKPTLDKIEIDPTRQSDFAREILEMPYEQIEPSFVDPDTDYEVVDDPSGARFYHSPNPINDLFSLSISIDLGMRQDNRLGVAISTIQNSGAGEFTVDELKKEWYRLGADFAMSTENNETNITLSGLDENFQPSVALMMELLKGPSTDDDKFVEMKEIMIAGREDSKKDPSMIHRALLVYNRLGKKSSFLQALTNEQLQALKVDELHDLIGGLLGYKQTIQYTGSLPMDEALRIVREYHPLKGTLKTPPRYEFLTARAPAKTEIYFHHKETAQAQIRLEFGDEVYKEARRPAMQLYDDYFGGGMAGIVFQELRESRALAYSAGAKYFPGARKGDQNLMIGAIGCQPDKALEAVDAFIELLDNLPVSPERFEGTRQSILNRYRTSKINFRGVVGAVRGWERLGLPVDPRKQRFLKISSADIDLMLDFHKKRIKDRPKLISIVGDKARIDMEGLAKVGKIVEIGLDDIFAY